MGCCRLRWTQNRWMALVAAMWLMASAGLASTFSLFSTAVKEALEYTQLEVDILATASDFGTYAGLLAALLCTVFPEWILLFVGAAMSGGGFLAIFLIATEQIPNPAFWQVALITLVAFNGTTFFSTVALVSSVRNFPRAQGLLLGLLNGLFGLSGAIYTTFYEALLPHDPHSFLLQLAIGPAGTALLVMFVFCGSWPAPSDEEEESKQQTDLQLGRFFQIMMAVALLLFAYTFALLVIHLTYPITTAVAILSVVLLVLPIITPLSLYTSLPSSPTGTEGQGPSVKPGETESVSRNGGRASSSAEPEAQNEERVDVTICSAVFSANFWLNAVAALLAGGSGLTLADNLAQIISADGNAASVDTAVSFISLWTFTGIAGGSYLAEEYLQYHALPRPIVTALAQLLMIPGHVIIALASLDDFLYVGCAFVGLGLGATITLSITTSLDVFGGKNFAVIYNLTRTAIPIGSFFFSSLLASYVYDGSVLFTGLNPSCIGVRCFQTTFFLMAVAALLGALLNFVLAIRTRQLYQGLYERHPSRTVALEDFPTEAFKA